MLLSKKEEIKKEEEESKEENKEILEYFVDIKGEVVSPGIYKLNKDSRVIDVINQAGGLTENANTTVINLSKKILDEMVIIVYSNYQVENFTQTKEIEKKLSEKCVQEDNNALVNDACIGSENIELQEENTGKISLNNATLEELMTLPGIGEAKAKNIITYREANEGFKSLDEVKNIEGIGESIFDKIKDYLTLG